MKTKILPIGPKALLALVLLFACTIAGCNDEKNADGDLPFDATARIEVGLENITLDNGAETTTRVGTTPLANGESFRLYVMKRNSTDIITSYTYTIVSGKPVMDAGQGDGKLYLPYGALDIYLASPVSVPTTETEGPDNKPVMATIAGPGGINPRQGVDLLVSCTPTMVNYTGTNTLAPLPLKHKMAKVKIRVGNENKDLLPQFSLVKVAVYNQSPDIGEYKFDNSDGGTITPTVADEVAGVTYECTGNAITTVKENEEYYSTFMLLPREAGKVKVEMELNIRPNNEPVVQLYRMSGIMENTPFVGGKQNLFYTEPKVSADIVWRPSLLPWNDQEEMSKPMNDLVFYLDGRDAPEYINGKLCWRDRSGNNNHAELSGNVTYNATDLYYDLPTENDIFKIPALGLIPEYTLEMVVSSAPTDGSAIFFSNSTGGSGDTRELFVHLPYSSNTIFFDAGNELPASSGGGRIEKALPDDVYSHSFRTYQFRKSNTQNKSSIYINGASFVGETTNNCDHEAFTYNRLGGKKKLKIRSVRLYRKCLSDAEVKKNYDADNSVYKADAAIVTNNLLLYLDGKTPPYTNADATATYWPDLSGNKHHAKFTHIGGKNHIVYTGLGYRFNNESEASFSCMEILSSLGASQDITLEIIMNSERENCTPFYSGKQADIGGLNRVLGIHVPHASGEGRHSIFFDSPLVQSPSERLIYGGPECSMSRLATVHSLVFTRQENSPGTVTKSLIMDGSVLTTMVHSTRIGAMEYTSIGNFPPGLEGERKFYYVGEIRAIRVYGKTLTSAEIIQNNLSDKARYKY